MQKDCFHGTSHYSGLTTEDLAFSRTFLLAWENETQKGRPGRNATKRHTHPQGIPSASLSGNKSNSRLEVEVGVVVEGDAVIPSGDEHDCAAWHGDCT